MVVIVDFTTLPSLELLVTDRLAGHGVGLTWMPGIQMSCTSWTWESRACNAYFAYLLNRPLDPSYKTRKDGEINWISETEVIR